MTCSWLTLLVECELVRTYDLHAHVLASIERFSEQPIARGHKPSGFGFLREREMERVEWTESEARKQACPFLDIRGGIDAPFRFLQPKRSREAPVFGLKAQMSI